jgi:hypothetical protein
MDRSRSPTKCGSEEEINNSFNKKKFPEKLKFKVMWRSTFDK